MTLKVVPPVISTPVPVIPNSWQAMGEKWGKISNGVYLVAIGVALFLGWYFFLRKGKK